MINSMAGHRVPPSNNAHFYSATKFAVTSLCEGFRQEVIFSLHMTKYFNHMPNNTGNQQLTEINGGKKHYIRICQISPGFVETEVRQE